MSLDPDCRGQDSMPFVHGLHLQSILALLTALQPPSLYQTYAKEELEKMYLSCRNIKGFQILRTGKGYLSKKQIPLDLYHKTMDFMFVGITEYPPK